MIYLDHAAATPVDKRVLEVMRPYFGVDFFNPSSAYLPAKKVAADYEKAKGTIAHAIGAKASDLIITAGATEANNLAFSVLKRGLISRLGRLRSAPIAVISREPHGDRPLGRGRPSVDGRERRDSERDVGPVLYLKTEHDSVRKVAEQFGGTAIRILPSGLIDLNDLLNKITDETELISISLVNNELGVIQPLADVAKIIREVKIDRMKRGIKRQLLLHSDASQALNLLDINVSRLGVDLLTLNSAKIYGPKGVGALYVSHDAKITPLVVGGGQENGMRSGTENVPGVIGFAKAVELAKEHLNGNRKKYKKMKQLLLQDLQDYELINKKHSLDNFVVLCYDGIDAERLIYLLEEKEVYVATGAACAASKGVRSHVLKAIGLSDSQIAGSLRLSLGETNSEEQIHEAAKLINEMVKTEKRRIDG